MTKFQLYSDIHLEFYDTRIPKPEPKAPYLILAGDIGSNLKKSFKEFIEYVSQNWEHVFFVFGNHEFYGNGAMETSKEKYKNIMSEFPNVHLLDNSFYKLEGITIYGFTAWTLPCYESTRIAKENLNDFNKIKTRAGKLTNAYLEDLSTRETNMFVDFLSSNEDDLLVVTHFAPLNKGMSAPEYEIPGRIMNNYFCWRNFIQQNNCRSDKIKIWCSGHTHWSHDFEKDGVRYISNQVGYRDENVDFSDGCFEMVSTST